MSNITQKVAIGLGIAAVVALTSCGNPIPIETPVPTPNGQYSIVLQEGSGMGCYALWNESGAYRNGVPYVEFLRYLEDDNHDSLGVRVDAERKKCSLVACPTETAVGIDGRPLVDCKDYEITIRTWG